MEANGTAGLVPNSDPGLKCLVNYKNPSAHLPRQTRLGEHFLVAKAGAEEGTRTPTAFRPPAPKAGASANSATSALPCEYSIAPKWLAPPVNSPPSRTSPVTLVVVGTFC